MLTMQRFPWEQGAASQAALEIGDFTTAKLLAHDAVLRQSPDGRLSTAFYRDDIAIFGDNITVTDSSANGEAVLYFADKDKDDALRKAADLQPTWLAECAPRTKGGVLYHVKNNRQVWVDSIFMALPFMVLMGADLEAEQPFDGFYRILHDSETSLLSHIWDEATGDFAHRDFWDVGNGWAAAGMAKIIRFLPDSEDLFKTKTIGMVTDIVDAVLKYRNDKYLFNNIIDRPETFVEVNQAQMICTRSFPVFRRAG